MRNFLLPLLLFFPFLVNAQATAWIRINQLGYTPGGAKTAVWGSKEATAISDFTLVDASTRQPVFKSSAGKAFGAYGPFRQTYRLNFSSFQRPGRYYLQAGNATSPVFAIADTVYKGAADFCLRYLRQQRSGFNPFLNDSCHTHDGFTVYAPVPDGTFIPVSGGWHDASDYLQYVTTSANATWHLLAAGRDFPGVFPDNKLANGLDGQNGIPDVLDEAKWGLDWLLKMHPHEDWLFNQVGDDRDHQGMRIPKEDTNFYNYGLQRPVYFCTGEPQGLLKYKNRATGVASTAGKFSSAFALGAQLFGQQGKAGAFNNSANSSYADTLRRKAYSAFALGLQKPGVCQTAPGRAPYFYEEDNWTDDMELAAAELARLEQRPQQQLHRAFAWARQEPVTPWLGKDTARHYQWYPFVNPGHYELARQLEGQQRNTLIRYYRTGITQVWNKAKENAFYRGIPFIWCSNNLTTAFAIQCYWYRQLSHDTTYLALEQACFDWLFGCNPWGTSMVYGLPAGGDTPVDPHSAFTHIGHYPIDGGLVDGPVYTNIFNNLIGVELQDADEYAPFQSSLAVYHDDYGDYSTNEPTMDGTAVLVYLLAAREAEARQAGTEKNLAIGQHSPGAHYTVSQGAIIRGDSSRREIALVFTADEFGDGLGAITRTLQQQQVKASFCFTGRFYGNPAFQPGIKELYRQGHYLGPHSDEHLLYCDWNRRDSLLVTRQQFENDMRRNLARMQQLGIDTAQVRYYIPPYEWWNSEIAAWSAAMGLQVMNFTPGTGSNADYTYPEMGPRYRSSDTIYQSIRRFGRRPGKLNGVILLLHAGTDPRRSDKFYNRLNKLIASLKQEGYQFKKLDEL